MPKIHGYPCLYTQSIACLIRYNMDWFFDTPLKNSLRKEPSHFKYQFPKLYLFIFFISGCILHSHFPLHPSDCPVGTGADFGGRARRSHVLPHPQLGKVDTSQCM